MRFLNHSGDKLIRVSKTIPERQYLYAVGIKLTTKPDNVTKYLITLVYCYFIFSKYWNLIMENKPLFIFVGQLETFLSIMHPWLVSPNQFIHYRQWEHHKPSQNKNESKQCPLMIGILLVVGTHAICCSYLCVVFWCKGKLSLLPSR